MIARKTREYGLVPLLNLVEGYGTVLLPLDVAVFVSGNEGRTVSLLFHPSRATMSLNSVFLLFCSDVCLAMGCWSGFEDFQLGAYPL